MKRLEIQTVLALVVALFLGSCASGMAPENTSTATTTQTVPGEQKSNEAGVMPAPGGGPGAKIGW
jgi:PBP1b-binding outer membrane lipoprotein LpoB